MTTRSNGVNLEFDVPAQMRDGVTLRSNVYRPAGPGPWPTLLARTPYGKDLAQVISWLDPVQTARRGFMVVIQDTRGRFSSDGEWTPFRNERDDGYDAVQWAAALRGSSGRVGMYGGSYWGNTQWMAAVARPPALAAIAPAVTWSDPMDGLFARGGAVELGLVVPWTLQQGLDYVVRTSSTPEARASRAGAILEEWDSLDHLAYRELPVHKMAFLARHGVPDLGSIRVLDEPGISSWCRVSGLHDRVAVPSFNLGGWYDIFIQGTLDNYEAMTAQGQPCRLVVGPWTHPTYADPIGEMVFGVSAGKDGIPAHPHGDVNDLMLAWLRKQLEPAAEIDLSDPPVRIFVMGRNHWRTEAAWPLTRAKPTQLFLHSDASLAPDAPAASPQGSSEFIYDPMDPVPTLGGTTVMWSGYPAGPFDQRKIEARRDVLVFSSAPLETELEVTGRIKAVLYAESSAPSADWVVRLCDVYPDGRSINICDGILRLPHGAQDPGPYEIDLWSTSIVFLPGHRLRVHVTSSSFPRWDRNLGTGRQGASDHQVSRLRVHHDAQRASCLVLPVVDG